MNQKISIVGILVDNRAKMGPEVQKVLTAHGSIIMARMGIPSLDKDQGLITLCCSDEKEKEQLQQLVSTLSDINGVQVTTTSFT